MYLYSPLNDMLVHYASPLLNIKLIYQYPFIQMGGERLKVRSPAQYQIQCPGLNANKIQIPYDKHHKVKSHQNKHNSVRYDII